MISSTLATLECTAQVTSAAITMHRTGSPVMEDITMRTPGAFSAGASVSSRMCSDSSISPRPIKTRPTSLIRERGPTRKATSPSTNRTGATAAMLNDSTCTIKRRADIGAEHDGERGDQAEQALGCERTREQRGRGAALEQGSKAETGGERVEAVTKRLAEEPSQVRAKGAQNPAVDHVQAPQQQRHAAHQIEQYQRSHAPCPDWSRLVRLAPNA
ncbi:hypothetical protein ACVWZK_005701 [Bradyrhizobium sp. GM0.4]